ncbi:ankyrin repeat protein [Tupanvirus soda lake]|uniref:Ankyrin repeat protein n=2 Tax=Tupanvirus TaxID=2094720 RepID=A0A6N1NMS3_9VIRU|nr:ankyrin repeat protein [Tupanvirus soda lake]QKU35694.1 ankyrin repeat protein [Tupanvirus soda lake]
MKSKLFFKITNANENHHGYQYHDGLNVLDKPFQESGSCVPGGLYFTDVENIFKFLNYGIYLRKIELPLDDPDFRMVQDKDGDKWRANKIILGEKRSLTNPETFQYLVSLGANIHTNYDYALRWSAEKGYLDVVKYLVDKGTDINADYDCALISSAGNGHLDIVKFLVENGANINANNDCALRWSAREGYPDIVEYLLKKGASIQYLLKNNYVLR